MRRRQRPLVTHIHVASSAACKMSSSVDLPWSADSASVACLQQSHRGHLHSESGLGSGSAMPVPTRSSRRRRHSLCRPGRPSQPRQQSWPLARRLSPARPPACPRPPHLRRQRTVPAQRPPGPRSRRSRPCRRWGSPRSGCAAPAAVAALRLRPSTLRSQPPSRHNSSRHFSRRQLSSRTPNCRTLAWNGQCRMWCRTCLEGRQEMLLRHSLLRHQGLRRRQRQRRLRHHSTCWTSLVCRCCELGPCLLTFPSQCAQVSHITSLALLPRHFGQAC